MISISHYELGFHISSPYPPTHGAGISASCTIVYLEQCASIPWGHCIDPFGVTSGVSTYGSDSCDSIIMLGCDWGIVLIGLRPANEEREATLLGVMGNNAPLGMGQRGGVGSGRGPVGTADDAARHAAGDARIVGDWPRAVSVVVAAR